MLVGRILKWIWEKPVRDDAKLTQELTRIEVAALDVIDAYLGNEIAADSAYKGKVVNIAGRVDWVGTELGLPVVYLANLLRCECVKSEYEKLKNIQEGDFIIVKGVVKGLFVGKVAVTGSRVQP